MTENTTSRAHLRTESTQSAYCGVTGRVMNSQKLVRQCYAKYLHALQHTFAKHGENLTAAVTFHARSTDLLADLCIAREPDQFFRIAQRQSAP